MSRENWQSKTWLFTACVSGTWTFVNCLWATACLVYPEKYKLDGLFDLPTQVAIVLGGVIVGKQIAERVNLKVTPKDKEGGV